MAGTAYLRDMHDRYGSLGFLAAYNAGPGRYEQYLRGARGLPNETQNYIAKLVPMIGGGVTNPVVASTSAAPLATQPLRPSWTQASLFASRSTDNGEAEFATSNVNVSAPRAASPAPLNGLFAPVSGRSTR